MTTLVRVPLPALAGSPGLVQGRYGESGNLELAVPGAHGGVWIFWFNADADTGVAVREGAPPRCWSGGLQVLAGVPVEAARISQLHAGPDHLELLALADGELHRLYWAPAEGFVATGTIAHGVVAAGPVRETPTSLTIDVRLADGRPVRLVTGTEHYPAATWDVLPRTDGPEPAPPPGLPADVPYDAVAWARTTLDGGRVDAVLRRGSGLAHLYRGPGRWSAPEPVVSQVWIADDAPVHRRS
ncbi:hypothetical protein SAMN05443575_0267 [Jatrophihabitans endophyticus]|uniref:Uncharacterized protein n=1 Tax=Jatrophihabitans endophyticus TaxID=1206085 RepID=A0A1M5CJL6_9ACTN|nr:hypothetical protein [Jatrophihabitans endophyticus]SHF54944.1 hypothetical protein SAMN05443575_0267 [Jatrophihabitans endophyticus]